LRKLAMLLDLLTKPVVIKRRKASDDDDDYGSEVAEETSVVTVGELQQQGRTEREGVISATSWLLILPPDVELDTNDVVVVDNFRFEISGNPWLVRNPLTGELHHIEATLERTGGEEVVLGGSIMEVHAKAPRFVGSEP